IYPLADGRRAKGSGSNAHRSRQAPRICRPARLRPSCWPRQRIPSGGASDSVERTGRAGESMDGGWRFLHAENVMIRFVLRFIGLLSLALGFIFLVHDGTKSIADQTVYISSVGSTWSNVHQNSLTALQPEVERRAGAWVWQGLIQPYFLDQPVS